MIEGDVSLTRVRDRATNAEGSEYEWEHFVVQQFIAGLVFRVELFALDAYAEARACFDALASDSSTGAPAPSLGRGTLRQPVLGRSAKR